LLQHGDPAPVRDDILTDAVDALEKGQQGPFRDAIPQTTLTAGIFARLAARSPKVLAVMHGSSFAGDGGPVLLQFEQALARVSAQP
jgi:hypothetical protein